MREFWVVFFGVLLAGLFLFGVQKAYDRHCTDIPLLGTFCAAKVGPPAFR